MKAMPIIVPPLAKTDPAGVFASFMTEAKYQDFPPEIVRRYKAKMLDTLAVLIGGVGFHGEQVVQMLDYYRAQGGKPEARVIGYGDRLPLTSAAFVNAVACRVLDFGDWEIEVDHFSEHILPVMLSLTDAMGRIDGKSFFTAFAASSEVTARIGHACFGMTYGYFSTEVPTKLPPIEQWGVVCGVAKMMGFTSEQTWDAIGHAYSTLSSTDAQATAEGTYMKSLEHGFTALNGLLCCELAKRGLRGTRNVFFGPRGFLANFYPFKSDPSLLTADLGKEWLDQVIQKKFACCGQTHCSIQGSMDIVHENKIRLDDVKSILCEVPLGFAPVIDPEKWNPTSAGMARFSLPYTVATGLIKGKVFVDDYTDKELHRPDVRALMTKIKAVTDKKLPVDSSRVTITTKDGRTFIKELFDLPGSRRYPLTWDDIVGKFRLIIKTLNVPLSEASQAEIINIVDGIEKVKNVKALVDLLMWAVDAK